MNSFGKLDKNPVDSGCVFCRMRFDEELSSEPTNELLYSGEFHYVIGGLGAWMPGYVLLVTHWHFDNFSLIPDETKAEFMSLFARINQLFIEEYGEVTIFEHGAIGSQHRAGGCINHAHIHFIARNVDLCRDLKREFRVIEVPNGSPYVAPLISPYLYVKQKEEDAQAFFVDRPLATQFLRKKIALKIGMEKYWDYRLYPFDDNIIRTIDVLKGRIE